jgi:hypothetical protein
LFLVMTVLGGSAVPVMPAPRSMLSGMAIVRGGPALRRMRIGRGGSGRSRVRCGLSERDIASKQAGNEAQ